MKQSLIRINQERNTELHLWLVHHNSMVVRCTFTISFITLRISTSLLSEIIFIESRLAHIINRAKTQCSFITLTKRYINIFCQLDGGELNYVFSILDKQTNSCRLLSKPKYRTDNVQKMLLVKLFSSQKVKFRSISFPKN